MQKYVHYKGGNYVKLHVGTHTETEEEMVVYLSCETGRVWIRPREMFDSHVEVEKGKIQQRFTEVGIFK